MTQVIANESKPGVRAARLEAILRATLEQLAFVGYRALSIEDVANKANVAKTTIYRRFPEKKDLVRAALSSFAKEIKIPDTGTLRGDLLALGHEFLRFASSASGQGILRVVALENADPELETIGDELRREREDAVAEILRRAVARGELAKMSDPKLLLDAFVGPLHLKLFCNNERVDEPYMLRLIDLLMHGAMPRAHVKPGK